MIPNKRTIVVSTTFPFLTSYDPPGASEGTLDPLGLYQIADQLAVQLVPAVRERMQRIRFLTAMAVGAMVTENIEEDPRKRDAAPCLVWEWLVVEALVRCMDEGISERGVPGSSVAKRAVNQLGYVDARSYLKLPRIYGFNGVYKRLAIHIGIVDVNLGPGPNAESVVDAWARGQGLGGIDGAKPLMRKWKDAVKGSMLASPARTDPGWRSDAWEELARAFRPSDCRTQEKKCLRRLLLPESDKLGALPAIWQLQEESENESLIDKVLHESLEQRRPEYAPLLQAIRAYEAFARSLQDAFDVMKAMAATSVVTGISLPLVGNDADFQESVDGLHLRFAAAHQALGEVSAAQMSLQNLFSERFAAFSGPMSTTACATALYAHHEAVQKAKSADGKRSWFDRIGPDRIWTRYAYREPRRDIVPGAYVHDYRGKPIRSFCEDLR